MINSPDSCPDANRNPVTQALRMTKWLLEYGSVSTQLPSCSFPFFNAPHCTGKRMPILTHISRALVSLGSSPEDAAPIKAGLRRRVVTVSEGTRSKGIHWRRGLCVLQTGRGLFVMNYSVHSNLVLESKPFAEESCGTVTVTNERHAECQIMVRQQASFSKQRIN
ncbi:hypothetical protein JOQ06_017178 [Pogonophryne albipinna]|uniref:Uncharacterized protein n=1 Tax=Pogonophryne albipinna TaxID=1090488 RepID=A0AAD6B2R9_9TELE|nr:hypothetical protein JOQ06_017178 [Pogonophryne albipinna]